jgi:tetratricopeptide (TPR) repeat protein
MAPSSSATIGLLVSLLLLPRDLAPDLFPVGPAPAEGPVEPATTLLTDQGIRFFAARDFPQACQRFADAVEREPDNSALRGNVARCFEGWGWQALRAGRAEEAMLLFRQGLQQSPDGQDLLKGLGVAAIHAGHPELAVDPLENVLRARLDADVTLLLARLYDQRDDAPRAVAHLRRLVAAHPEHREARRLLGKLERERAIERDLSREETAHFVVKYRAAGGADVRGTVTRTLEALYEDMGARLGHSPVDRIVVILYPDERFQEVTGTHDWVSGLFDGKIRLSAGMQAMDGPALERLLAHEYTHAFVHQVARGRAPRWLHEGLAQHFEGVEEQIVLGLPYGVSLTGIEALLTDGDVDRARTGYRAALWVVRDLLERGGLPAIADLLTRLGRGQSGPRALASVYGLSLGELERQWRRVLGGPSEHARVP